MQLESDQRADGAVLAAWAANSQTGFLPLLIPSTCEQLARSPHATARELGKTANAIGDMSDVELERLVGRLSPDADFVDVSPQDCEALVRSYVCVGAHLVHRPAFAPRKELPPAIARPLWALSHRVGRPPSLTYASYVLANLAAPFDVGADPETLVVAQTPSCTADEAWFVAVHQAVESIGGRVVAAIETIEGALARGDDALVVEALAKIQECTLFATSTMPRVREHLDPEVFREKIRPLLYGYERIVFRGVPGDPVMAYIGETGAQSGAIRAIDAILDARHSDGMTHSMNRFLACAPPAHQQFFAHAGRIGSRLAACETSSVRSARQAALYALADFRTIHLEVVLEYLQPNGQRKAELGTGGTPFQIWLQRLIDETAAAAASA